MTPDASGARRLGWFDGFVFALTMPAALIATLGYSVGALGGWAAIVLWTVSMLIALVANTLYAEMAGMFPDTSGGIAVYAHRAWRGRVALVGPVASFGYWFAWTSSLAVYGQIVGSLVVEQWLGEVTWSGSLGPVDVTPAKLIAIGLLLVVWLANVLGARPTVWVAYLTAAALLVPLAVFVVATYLTGDWEVSRLSWGLGEPGQAWGGWQLAVVWLYIMLWTSLGVETCATFTPEYRDPIRDSSRALRVSAIFCLGVFALLPLGLVGTVGEAAAAQDPIGVFSTGFEQILGGAGGLMIALLCLSLLLVMVTSMADGSRALYGISREGMTLRQIGRLNRFGVPGRAVTIDLAVNVCLILFVGNLLAIIAAGNLGYILAHVLALGGFALLRRDRPHAHRPVRAPGRASLVAVGLAAVLAAILLEGAISFDLTGYGGLKELLIAAGLLSSSVLLFAYRRVVQDRGRIHLREPEAATGE